MTKNERALRQQIKELEKLVEIKTAVITELKSMVTTRTWWTTPTNPWYNTTTTDVNTSGFASTTPTAAWMRTNNGEAASTTD